jgi:hypothetical protein
MLCGAQRQRTSKGEIDNDARAGMPAEGEEA